ncbi:UDP-glucose 4-epimerase [Kaistia soli DSM 19436]|uniref:UDP-glucose 4-epimerase n=1 Tax=Kaistia soli DSM 19436 TaxID=1122133 RepID=A0A1M5IHS6_9HYPH|nr:NAD(P)-dependent oxidoreductase [Kaistia soli]SHG27343.1 UDP-glucose 4-epimerase [Kaistia soli DSM 19436]
MSATSMANDPSAPAAGGSIRTIAVTGGSGRIGRAITDEAVRRGHRVISIDRVAPPAKADLTGVHFVEADIGDYDALVEAFRGADALIHMAAIPAPGRHPDHIIHNNNVVGSYNALRAAVEVGITRMVQASSVNAIGLSFSREAHFDYLPLDEQHPNYSEEPYSLSKWICEQQADSFARRYSELGIASMRFHYVCEARAKAAEIYAHATPEIAKHLWAYTTFDAAARACLQALDAPFTGHEVFYIVAPDTVVDIPSLELSARFFPDVPVRGDLSGYRSFFSSAKAERMLGWRHTLD